MQYILILIYRKTTFEKLYARAGLRLELNLQEKRIRMIYIRNNKII